ncbi:MAG: thioredoxin family protein [Saprospiraceae bacterium]|nr:thioredoxin family protein [Saprospiraceae bacterium]
MFRVVFLMFLLSGCTLIIANNPEELGRVEWLRDLEEASQIASKEKKPILILFQEIPGCLTCKTYGKVVLSHPLIVETIETYFVPVAIYNNRTGKDASVLAYYREPSWNNPVVRIVSDDKSDLVPRLNGNYTPSGLVAYLIHGMKKAGYPIPDYLPRLSDELAANEKGVEKNPSIINLETIIKEGEKTNCADQLYFSNEKQKNKAQNTLGQDKVKKAEAFRLDEEPKYYLSKTDYRLVPMSAIQSVKINALIGQGKSPLHLLSPRQQMMYHFIQKSNSQKWVSKINDDDWQEKMYQAWDELGCRA